MFKFVRFAAALVASATSALLQVPSQANISSSSYLPSSPARQVEMASFQRPWVNSHQTRPSEPIEIQMSGMVLVSAVRR